MTAGGGGVDTARDVTTLLRLPAQTDPAPAQLPSDLLRYAHLGQVHTRQLHPGPRSLRLPQQSACDRLYAVPTTSGFRRYRNLTDAAFDQFVRYRIIENMQLRTTLASPVHNHQLLRLQDLPPYIWLHSNRDRETREKSNYPPLIKVAINTQSCNMEKEILRLAFKTALINQHQEWPPKLYSLSIDPTHIPAIYEITEMQVYPGITIEVWR
ncbi:hypothetical protein ACJJTC_012673 [Scirpophaga incertulas]